MRKKTSDRGFKEWLRMDEISKISHLDTSDIKLKMSPSGYTYSFTYVAPDGPATKPQDFKVDMARSTLEEYDGIPLPSEIVAYAITFSGPAGYSLTGVAGSGAVAIYSKLMSAVKKLMEIDDVDVLSFTAYDKKMLPVYDRFMKTMLPDFTQVDDGNYVRTTVLNRVLDSLPETKRGEVMDKIAASHKERLDSIRKIKADKEINRKAKFGDRPSQVGKPEMVARHGLGLSMGAQEA